MKLIFDNNKTYIYCLKDPITKEIRYVGKGNEPMKRYYKHINLYGNNKHKQAWIIGLKKKGLKPLVEIIEEVNKNLWQEKEKYYISIFRESGYKLLNNTDGGDGLEGWKHSKKTKNKMRKTAIKNGNKPPSRKGIKQTIESKKQNRISHLGKKHSEKSKKIMSEKKKGKNHPMYGKKLSEEHKKKLIESHKGKISWNKGIPCSEETKRKISETKRNRNRT